MATVGLWLEYADIVLFGEDADDSLLTTLINDKSMYAVRLSPFKYEMLLHG